MKTKLLKKIRRKYRIIKETSHREKPKYYIEKCFNLLYVFPIWFKVVEYGDRNYYTRHHQSIMIRFNRLILQEFEHTRTIKSKDKV